MIITVIGPGGVGVCSEMVIYLDGFGGWLLGFMTCQLFLGYFVPNRDDFSILSRFSFL